MDASVVERPLDLLNNLKSKPVLVLVKGKGERISGILVAFDIHVNLVLEIEGKLTFIRGESVIEVS